MFKEILKRIIRSDYYNLYLSIAFIIAGLYGIINHKLAKDPELNLIFGSITLGIGLIIFFYQIFIKRK